MTQQRATLVAGVEGMTLYVNDHWVGGPKPWAGGVVRNEWRLHLGALDKAIGRRFLSAGWAVRIRPSVAEPGFVAWLNAGGGYSPERHRREVWGQRWEAEDAARPWKDCKPALVRVRFYSRGKP